MLTLESEERATLIIFQNINLLRQIVKVILKLNFSSVNDLFIVLPICVRREMREILILIFEARFYLNNKNYYKKRLTVLCQVAS